MSKRYSPNTPDMKQPNNTMARLRTLVDTRTMEYGRVRATVRDKNGNIIGDVDQKVDSLLTNFWRSVYQTQAEITNQNYTVMTGGALSTNSRRLNTDAKLEDYAGIVVGSSNTAVSYLQTNLGTVIVHGTGSGQLSAEETSNYYDPITNTIEIVRTFVNADTNASAVVVRECGLGFAIDTGGALGNTRLYCRDVLGSELSIPFEGVLTVIYTIQFANGNANYTRIFGSVGYRLRSQSFELSNIVNTTGSSFTGAVASFSYGLLSVVGDDNNGIIVGTSNTNPTELNTWALESKVAHGEGGGQLFYYESTITSLEEDGATNSCRWYLNRVVQNRSGSPITVNEIGLSMNVTINSTNAVFMIDRKFPDEGGVTITNGQFATFSWEFCYIL